MMFIWPVLLVSAAVWALHRRAPAAAAVVYRRTGTPPENMRRKAEWTSLARLEKDLQFYARCGFTCVFPDELTRARKPLVLAFFGGYQSFFTEVFPLLQKYRAKACVFLVQNTIGTYDSWHNPADGPWQPVLTQAQLDTLAASGLVAFGTLGLAYDTGNGAREIKLTQNDLDESIARLKKLHRLSVCAAACTAPHAPAPDTQLPVLLTQTGLNAPAQTRRLRVVYPSLRTRFLLWQHR